MFFRHLKRLRPETSFLLAALAVGVAAACTPADDEGTGNPTPTGGIPGGPTGGAGGATAGSPTGGGTTGGVAGPTGGGTTGGVAGPTGGGTTGGVAGPTGGTTGGVGGTTGGSATGGTGGTMGGSTTGGMTGGTAGGGAGEPMNFPGKAAGCTSYGAPMLPAKCSGYYCNISLAQLEPALGTKGPCTGFTAMDVCDGQLTRDVAACARSEKTNPANILAGLTDEQLRPKVEACVRAKPKDYTKVTAQCMSCFLDAAQCAGSKCLDACLFGDSAGCDKCRMDNNCNQPVPKCGGLPNPF